MNWGRFSPPTHPPLEPDWTNAPHYKVELGDFSLENGEVIHDFSVSLATHGNLESGLPVTLVLCAIGSTHHRLDFLIGPGNALDPQRTLILAVDAIGNGLTTSPSNSLRQPAWTFPRFSIRDMVHSQKRALEAIGIHSLDAVIGASMGGMQALQWGVSYPAFMRRLVALTPMAKTTPWSAAVNEIGRSSLLSLLNTAGYVPASSRHQDHLWDAWIATMHLLAMRTPEQVDGEFGSLLEMRQWLEQRRAWWQRQGLDPLDWIYQSWAYDSHDLGTSAGFHGDTTAALQSILAQTFIAAPSLDLYNPTSEADRIAAYIPRCKHLRLNTNWGHSAPSSADGMSVKILNEEIAKFLA